MTRAYLRLDPAMFERKAIQQDYPLQALAAFVGVLCLADAQPDRGRFRDEKLLRVLLGKAGRFVPELFARGDLVRMADGRIYVDGWDEWQEGDFSVPERMRRMRARKRNAVTVEDVTPRLKRDGTSVTTPLPPTSGGRRANGTNPRAVAAELTRRANEAEADRKRRRKARHMAYLDGRITDTQRLEMDERDAPLDEIPASRGAAFQAASA